MQKIINQHLALTPKLMPCSRSYYIPCLRSGIRNGFSSGFLFVCAFEAGVVTWFCDELPLLVAGLAAVLAAAGCAGAGGITLAGDLF